MSGRTLTEIASTEATTWWQIFIGLLSVGIGDIDEGSDIGKDASAGSCMSWPVFTEFTPTEATTWWQFFYRLLTISLSDYFEGAYIGTDACAWASSQCTSGAWTTTSRACEYTGAVLGALCRSRRTHCGGCAYRCASGYCV